jgi:3-phenylpropionate/trans-cinnamate dioxygenase ferredoxin reductase subunit
MSKTKYLLIGGGLASSRAAAMLHMKDPDGAITLVCAEPQLPYDRPALSKELLRGETGRSDIFYDSPASLEEKNITTVLDASVTSLEPDAHEATLSNGSKITYEKAFIATGSEPVALDVPGAELEGVHYLRTLDDAQAIADAADGGGRAVVVGAGFIGMEVAASLSELSVDVTVVETESHIWPRLLDPNLAELIQNYCGQHGIEFATGDTVKAIEGRKRVELVRLASGQELACDFVVVGIGVSPRLDLAREAGLSVEDGIVVDEFLRTSHPDIYAGGDIVNFPDPVFGRRRVEHWGHAEYCGQVAALNMTGNEQPYEMLSYLWSDIFELHLEVAGDETQRDRVILRGTPEDGSFAVLYLKENRLRAYLAVNTDKRAFPPMQKLIRKGTNLAGRDEDLADPDFDLKELL